MPKQTRLRRLKNAQDSSRKLQRVASPVLELAHVSTRSGDILGLSARIVNWEPWYTVYQEHEYETSSFYDGPDFARAARMYKDTLIAFRGPSAAEDFDKQAGLYMEKIKNFASGYSNGFGNENMYLRSIMPKFLGFLDM